jgi:tetratricopeptide (TPR) repeat protein
MGEHTLTLLHLSDLHQDAMTSWRRRRVLGDAWKRNLDEMAGEGDYDLVCFTGDAAFSGQAAEYERATDFFGAVLERLGLGWERFFPVPGNHDIDRGRGTAEWRALRAKLPRARREEVPAWLAGSRTPLGFDDDEREAVLARQAAYRKWVRGVLGRPDLDPAGSGHGLLGYRWTWPTGSLGALPFPVHIVGLDSAWASGDNYDAGKLWLTDDQVMRLATDEGETLAGFRLALVHHPLDELADGLEARRLLAERVDLLLRGHLHDPETHQWADPERLLLQVVGGCLYEDDRYPNGCARLRVTLDGEGRPQRHELWFRGWSGRGFWHDDDSLYPATRHGRLTWWIERRPAEAASDDRAARVFVGREQELEQLEKHLLAAGGVRSVAVCSLQGMAGVGKSYLANRFALLHQEHFPGGVWQLVPEAGGKAPMLQKLLGELADRLKLAPGGDDLAARVRKRLLHPASLLLIENVDSEPLAALVAGLVARLPGCAVLVTGRYQGLGAAAGWGQVRLEALEEAPALALLTEEMGPEAIRYTNDEKRQLVATLGYLPLAIHLAGGYLWRGHSVSGFLAQLRASGFSLATADIAERALSRESSRGVIASTFALSLDALAAELAGEPEGGSERLLTSLSDLGHAPAAGFGVNLGSALAGLSPAEFEHLSAAAWHLSIVERIAPAERRDRAWRLHPLLAELLRGRGESNRAQVVHARISDWFCARLPKLPAGQDEEQGRRWREVQAEMGALVAWLGGVPPGEGVDVERAGSRFAILNGPFYAWLSFCERLLRQVPAWPERSHLLWTLGQVARRAGDFDRALEAAREKITLDSTRGDDREAALAAGLVADVLHDRGDLAGALRIRREEELPVYERLGDLQERAFTLGKIADALEDRRDPEDLDEALRIRRNEELPVYEQFGDIRARAVALGKVADILQGRGELDEALRIRREEELPVYEQIGDERERALSLGRIASVLEERGDLDAALRIYREEELPVYERLGLARDLAVGQLDLALLLLRRNREGDRPAAIALLHMALTKAEWMRLPEAETIRLELRALGERCQA